MSENTFVLASTTLGKKHPFSERRIQSLVLSMLFLLPLTPIILSSILFFSVIPKSCKGGTFQIKEEEGKNPFAHLSANLFWSPK